jgi:hypothetical protein
MTAILPPLAMTRPPWMGAYESANATNSAPPPRIARPKAKICGGDYGARSASKNQGKNKVSGRSFGFGLTL